MKKFLLFILLFSVLITGFVFLNKIATTPNIDNLEQEKNIEKLYMALDHKDEEIQVKAEEALIRLGPVAVDWIMEHEKEDDADIEKITNVLGMINNDAAFNALVYLLNNNDPADAEYAIQALTTYGEKAVSPLMENLKKYPGRTDIYRGLIAIGKPSVKPISELLVKSYGENKQNAFWVLQGIQDPSSEPFLITLLEDNELVDGAAELIVTLHDEDVTVLFPYLLDKSTVNVYKTIILYGDDRSIALLETALNQFGDEKMAEYYLNCENTDLESAAKNWASANGYSVSNESTFLSNDGVWGSK